LTPKEHKGAINLWNGWAVDAREGDCSLFLEHIKQVMCLGVDEHYRWVISWMADAVQNFGKRKNTVMLVLHGREGTGKGIIANKLGELFGRHFKTITNPKHLVGHFNGHLQDAGLVLADEAFFAGDPRHADALKAVVSESQILIEPKGREAFMAKNHFRVIACSNHDWVVRASADSRRYAVFEVSEEHREDKAYFQAISDQMDNGGREALLHFLQSIQISEWGNPTKAPETEALKAQRAESLRGFDAWVVNLVSNGHKKAWPNTVYCSDLYEDYKEWMRREDPKSKVSSSTAFGIKLKHRLGDSVEKLRDSKGTRRWFYEFEDQATAARVLATNLKIPETDLNVLEISNSTNIPDF
jgi:phage/plasmid-associated DNA primase